MIQEVNPYYLAFRHELDTIFHAGQLFESTTSVGFTFCQLRSGRHVDAVLQRFIRYSIFFWGGWGGVAYFRVKSRSNIFILMFCLNHLYRKSQHDVDTQVIQFAKISHRFVVYKIRKKLPHFHLFPLADATCSRRTKKNYQHIVLAQARVT